MNLIMFVIFHQIYNTAVSSEGVLLKVSVRDTVS